MKTKDFDFDSVYLKQCSLESATPFTNIRTMARSKFIEIEAQKLQQYDWNALLNTLSFNKDMEKISFRNKHAIDNFYETTQDQKYWRSSKKYSLAIDQPVTLRRLVKSLTSLFFLNKSLTVLSLEGLQLNSGHLTCLVKTLKSSQVNLKSLSFAYCKVGDEGAKIILRGLDDSISVLNLSGCSLSFETALLLAEIIKSHAVRRHDEAWKHTLRYQLPNFDRMNCLRRLTINDNPLIGDKGVKRLADALENDVWVKAVDLQRCGVTLEGAKKFLNLLKLNTSLFIVDIRENDFNDETIMEEIYEQLNINCGNGQSSFFWLGISPQSRPETGRKLKVDIKSHEKEIKKSLDQTKLQLKKKDVEGKEMYEQLCTVLEENKRLKEELAKQRLLVNGEFLSYIDNTFKQFNAFIAAINGNDREPKSIVDAYLNKEESGEGELFRAVKEDIGDAQSSWENEYSNDFIDDGSI